MKLQKAAARTTALALYLQNFRKLVGPEKYINSYIRKEHGTGTGFFGISNTGSRDCLKESIRGITDALRLSYRTPDALLFRTISCLDVTVFDRNKHRIEHTIEVMDLFRAFEKDFILEDRTIELADVGRWVIENQVTTLIEQQEQRRLGQYTTQLPFSKYSSPVLYNRKEDVSAFSREDLRTLTRSHFKDQISRILEIDAKLVLKATIASFDGASAKAHTLPPLEIAARHHNDEHSLLAKHYRHKLSKRLNPNSRWFSDRDAERYRAWQIQAQ